MKTARSGQASARSASCREEAEQLGLSEVPDIGLTAIFLHFMQIQKPQEGSSDVSG